jgi:hypothetical protein
MWRVHTLQDTTAPNRVSVLDKGSFWSGL